MERKIRPVTILNAVKQNLIAYAVVVMFDYISIYLIIVLQPIQWDTNNIDLGGASFLSVVSFHLSCPYFQLTDWCTGCEVIILPLCCWSRLLQILILSAVAWVRLDKPWVNSAQCLNSILHFQGFFLLQAAVFCSDLMSQNSNKSNQSRRGGAAYSGHKQPPKFTKCQCNKSVRDKNGPSNDRLHRLVFTSFDASHFHVGKHLLPPVGLRQRHLHQSSVRQLRTNRQLKETS